MVDLIVTRVSVSKFPLAVAIKAISCTQLLSIPQVNFMIKSTSY